MVTAFLYEFVTGGGTFHVCHETPPSGSLLREGAAMWKALVQDLARVPDTRVITTWDVRLPRHESVNGEVSAVAGADDERIAFETHAKAADLTILIAPEFDKHLCSRAKRLEELGVRLASPCSEFIQAASDKCALAELLLAENVAVPRGRRVAAGEKLPSDFSYPAVLKPNDGAGSLGLRLVAGPESTAPDAGADIVYRLEEFVDGCPCSISFLCGDGEPVPLPPFRQCLSTDGSFTYLGGRRLMDGSLCRRVERLGRKALSALPHAVGYVGIDLVLGDHADGSQDYLIEVNPRVTTSYIGLRAVCRNNLAEVMLAKASGGTAAVSWSPEPVDFYADGTVRVLS